MAVDQKEGQGFGELDPILYDAVNTELLELAGRDQFNNTHVVRRYGEDIGATSISIERVLLGPGREARSAKINNIGTAEGNLPAVYLGILMRLIENDPRLKEITGPEEPDMALLAAHISENGYLTGWICEYELSGIETENKRKVYRPFEDEPFTTFDPEDMRAHVAQGGGKDVIHRFLSSSRAERILTSV